MVSRRYHAKRAPSRASLTALLSSLAGATMLVLAVRSPEALRQTRHLGAERLVAVEALPEMNGPMCELAPASAQESLMAALMQSSAPAARVAASDGTAPPRPSEASRAEIAARRP